jgi:alanine racemase
MLMVDLSMFEGQDCIGFDVELWGENISVSDVAKNANTISYSLFCGLNRRVSKQYIR